MFMKNDIKKTQHPNSIKCLIYKRKTAPVIGAVNYGGPCRTRTCDQTVMSGLL